MENRELFRKEAVDRVASPEQLNDYIHVTSPAIWMALAGIICILVGFIVWGIFGNVYSTVDGAGIVRDHNLTVYIRTSDREAVKAGMDITVNGQKTVVREISAEPERVPDDVSDYVLDAAGFGPGEWAYKAEADTELDDGVYSASITVEKVHPIKFVIN